MTARGRADFLAGFLGVGFDVIDNAFDQGVFEPFLHRATAPGILDGLGLVLMS